MPEKALFEKLLPEIPIIKISRHNLHKCGFNGTYRRLYPIKRCLLNIKKCTKRIVSGYDTILFAKVIQLSFGLV